MKILFAFAALFISLTGFCQKEDYLVKNNGDTVRGYIEYKNGLFHVGETKPVEVKADDVAWVKSKKYRGNILYSGKLRLYSDNLIDFEFDYTKREVVDTVLLLDEIYSTPKMNLYYGQSDLKLPLYFYKTPTDPRPIQLVISYHLEGGLANHRNDPIKYRGENSRVYIVENKGYVNQLKAIMGDCKKISEPMWELLSYRDYSLKQIIKKYNKCN